MQRVDVYRLFDASLLANFFGAQSSHVRSGRNFGHVVNAALLTVIAS